MALTPAEIFEHVGRAIKYGSGNMTDEKYIQLFDSFTDLSISIAKQYRLNGASGTQAERAEAMKAMVHFLYEDRTGRDPVADAHHLKKHWVEGVEPGEGGNY